jgi:hypothetical protein
MVVVIEQVQKVEGYDSPYNPRSLPAAACYLIISAIKTVGVVPWCAALVSENVRYFPLYNHHHHQM